MSDWIIYTDGAARGNPGPAAIAYIIHRPGEKDVEYKECLGTATNNVAEYKALVKALDHAAKLGGKRLTINSDSDLLVQQMKGNFKVKHENIIPLHAEANRLARHFEHVAYQHIPRAKNARTDALCNAALDGDRTRAPVKKTTAKASPDHIAQIRDEAVECLRHAANAWMHGGKQLTPEQVWEQLASILEEAGVLPSK